MYAHIAMTLMHWYRFNSAPQNDSLGSVTCVLTGVLKYVSQDLYVPSQLHETAASKHKFNLEEQKYCIQLY